MSIALTGMMLFLSGGTALADVDNTVQAKLVAVEKETYGTPQTGPLLDRLASLEKGYFGREYQGSMLERVDTVYNDIYDNEKKPSLLTELNAVEWGILHKVSDRPIDKRITDLEMYITGQASTGTYASRIAALGRYAFGTYEVPLRQITVPKDTLIRIALTQNINAKDLKAGDIIHFKVAQDVLLNDMLVFVQGQAGEGTVTKVVQARNFGRDARIDTDFHSVQAMDGTTVATFVGDKAKEEMQSYAMAAGASLAGMALLGPIGIIGGAFVHGKNVELPAGTELYVQTKADTVLYAVPTTTE